MDEYLTCKKHIEAIISVPAFTPHDTFGRDMTYLLSKNLTFAESLTMKEVVAKGKDKDEQVFEKKSIHGFEIAVMQRISIMRTRIYDTLAASGAFA